MRLWQICHQICHWICHGTKTCAYQLTSTQYWLPMIQRVLVHRFNRIRSIPQLLHCDKKAKSPVTNLSPPVTNLSRFLSRDKRVLWVDLDGSKCTDMITNSHSHDLGAAGALETVFWEIRFSNLARMVRVTRTHPLSGIWVKWDFRGLEGKTELSGIPVKSVSTVLPSIKWPANPNSGVKNK